jgi:hypothetical protein
VLHLKDLHTKYQDKVVIIGVHSKKGGDRMPAFVTKEAIPYIVAHDSEGKTQAAYGADSFPDYYLIDKKGNLRFADLSNREVDRAIEFLLAE